MKKTETFDQKIDRLATELKEVGYVNNDRYSLTLSDESPDILLVFDRRDKSEEGCEKIVAYSSMKADFEPSLREFIEDYIA